MSKVKEFFEKLNTDANAAELFKGKKTAEDPEEAVNTYLDAAKKLGFELTADEIKKYFVERERELKEKTNSTAKAVQALPDDELDKVAGGGDHDECEDTYMDRENCWIHDGCDLINTHYPDYECHLSYKGHCGLPGYCGYQFSML